jgi:hypothetical protein
MVEREIQDCFKSKLTYTKQSMEASNTPPQRAETTISS